MKILILGVGAFGIAILKHLSSLHPDKIFYAYEKDPVALAYLIKERRSLYFFSDYIFPKNVVFMESIVDILPSTDLIILAIPNQFIHSAIVEMKSYLHPGVTFLNLSKGIDNTSLYTVSDTIADVLGDFSYHYACLSGGMIAKELMDGEKLGAQIGTSDLGIGTLIKNIFENENLHLDISQEYKNIELYGALKNIIAMYIGYLEGQGCGYSSIGYYFCELLKELPILLELLGGAQNTEFSQYAFGGDLIATCFGQSRNRYFGNLVGSGKTVGEALDILKGEKKHAEGYETLKGLKGRIQENKLLENYNTILRIFSTRT